MDVLRALIFMMSNAVMFGKVITVIGVAGFPKKFKLFLVLSIPKPMIVHVPRFGFLLVDIVVDKSMCSRIVCLDGGWGLLVAKTL